MQTACVSLPASRQCQVLFVVTHWTSSRIVVKGNSGPYLPLDASLSLAVTGLADPYGLPRLFMQTMKNLDVSKTLPGPPSSGPHQSLTSALPVRAWQMTMALSPFVLSFPRVVYATGTLRRVAPDSSLNSGIMAICWSGIRAANGFSGWDDRLSYRYSVAVLWRAWGLFLDRVKSLVRTCRVLTVLLRLCAVCEALLGHAESCCDVARCRCEITGLAGGQIRCLYVQTPMANWLLDQQSLARKSASPVESRQS